MTSCHSALHNQLKCSDFCMRVRRKGPEIFETWVVSFNIGRKYQNSLTSEKGIKRCRKEMSYTLLCGSSRKLHAGATRFLVSGTSIGCFFKKREDIFTLKPLSLQKFLNKHTNAQLGGRSGTIQRRKPRIKRLKGEECV